MYLLPEAMAALAPKLHAALAGGAVVVCNTWGLKNLTPTRTAAIGPFQQTALLLYTRQSLGAAYRAR